MAALTLSHCPVSKLTVVWSSSLPLTKQYERVKLPGSCAEASLKYRRKVSPSPCKVCWSLPLAPDAPLVDVPVNGDDCEQFSVDEDENESPFHSKYIFLTSMLRHERYASGITDTLNYIF